MRTFDMMKTQASPRDNAWLKHQQVALEKLYINGDTDFAEFIDAKFNLKNSSDKLREKRL